MPDRLLVDIEADGRAVVSSWLDGELPSPVVEPVELAWPLSAEELEELRWYLEDYLRAPFGVYEDRGPRVGARLSEWGQRIFDALFASPAARDAYVRLQARAAAAVAAPSGARPELIVRSADPGWLAVPWELLMDPSAPSPVALESVAISRSLPTSQMGEAFRISGERLRVLMVISRPRGAADVGYRMIARPLLHRLEAVRGRVELVVLRPPTLEALKEVLAEARETGEPFQVVHFDGHGVLTGASASVSMSSSASSGAPVTFSPGEAGGVLVFEAAGGGPDQVPAQDVARVLAAAKVPVVVLNACQSGALGKALESTVATRLLAEGASSVVAMAYSVYAVAAAEFIAAFYKRLFAGDSISDAVVAGRARLALKDQRPSPRGKLALADWLVPVHYFRREAHFPNLQPASSRRQGLSLDADLDALRDRAAVPQIDNLAPRDEFVGRDGVFYTLEVAARLQRVVLVYGPGGSGKTELAKAFGRWWRDTGAIDDSQWVIWHSLEPGVATFGLDGLLSAIGLRVYGVEFAKREADERRAVVRNLLRTRRLLLVLDNFESVYSMPDPSMATPPLDEAGRDELAGFLAEVASGSRSAVIITSRSPEVWLGQQLRRVELAGFDVEEASEYADQLLAPLPAAQERRRHRSFGELMEWLDGHPLSMRLTLPQLEHTTPEELLARLQGLVPLSGESEGHRAASLPASITYSITHLDQRTRRLLVAVCLFHGVVDADVLGAFAQVEGVPSRFAGADTGTWGAILDAAAGVGLLTELGAGMYSIHPALPGYLADQWRSEQPDHYPNERAAAQHALLKAYVAFAQWLTNETETGDAGLAMSLIDRQRRTMGHLLGRALETARWMEAYHLAFALYHYWNARALHAEAEAWVDRARLALEGRDGSRPGLNSPAGRLWLFLLGAEANRQTDAHELDAAHATHSSIRDALLTQPPSEQRDSDLATANHGLGRVAHERGALEEAKSWYQQALAIREELDDRPGMATSYHQLGMVAQERGALDEARNWYQRSLAIEKELGNRPGMATSYHQLGRVAEIQRAFEEAQSFYQRSLAIREILGKGSGMAQTYGQLGNLAMTRGALAEAEEWYQRCLVVSEDLGNRPAMSKVYHQLGTLALQRGKQDEAEDWYKRSLAIKEELDDRPGIVTTYHQLGKVAQDRGALEEAHAWYLRALPISEEWRKAATYHQLGRIAQLRGALDEARDLYQRSLAINEGLGNRPDMAMTYGQLGLLDEAAGRKREALMYMVRCVTMFQKFLGPNADPGPSHLTRLTGELGYEALEVCWLEVTGGPVPEAVLSYIQSRLEQE